MELSEDKLKEYMKRLMLARMHILSTNGFYGLLLMHMKYSIDPNSDTAYTDGDRIAFSPKFMDELSDSELEFVLMHEIMHVVLRHCTRDGDRDHFLFNCACDIVVNSNIKHSLNDDEEAITLKKYGPGMHLTPDGKEGWLFTAEEVYDLLVMNDKSSGCCNKNKKGSNHTSGDSDSKDDDSDDGKDDNSSKDGNGKNDEKSGTRGKGNSPKKSSSNNDDSTSWDDHSKWKENDENKYDDDDLWKARVQKAAEAVKVRERIIGRGLVPLGAQRLIEDYMKPKTDWRQILNEFIQEDIVDYSFEPPDRRFGDGDFFLPDFNEKDYTVKNILFMVDTSGSVSDIMLTRALSEILGAIEQFGGKLEGKLGFFDGEVIAPTPFTSEDEFKLIKAGGGGGTDFKIIFEYIDKHMSDDPPVSIIIITDGYAPFPPESAANGVPVLWLIVDSEVKPPWGKVAYVNSEED